MASMSILKCQSHTHKGGAHTPRSRQEVARDDIWSWVASVLSGRPGMTSSQQLVESFYCGGSCRAWRANDLRGTASTVLQSRWPGMSLPVGDHPG